MRKPTIYEIKERTMKTSPYFFSRDTMREVKVKKTNIFGLYEIHYAVKRKSPTGDVKKSYRTIFYTERDGDCWIFDQYAYALKAVLRD